MSAKPIDPNLEAALSAVGTLLNSHKTFHTLDHPEIEALLSDSYKFVPKLMRAERRLKLLAKK